MFNNQTIAKRVLRGVFFLTLKKHNFKICLIYNRKIKQARL